MARSGSGLGLGLDQGRARYTGKRIRIRDRVSIIQVAFAQQFDKEPRTMHIITYNYD